MLDRIMYEIDTILLSRESRTMHMKDLKLIRLHANLHYKAENPDPNKSAKKQRADLLEAVEKHSTSKAMKRTAK